MKPTSAICQGCAASTGFCAAHSSPSVVLAVGGGDYLARPNARYYPVIEPGNRKERRANTAAARRRR